MADEATASGRAALAQRGAAPALRAGQRVAAPTSRSGPKSDTTLVEGRATRNSMAHYQDEGKGLELSPATVLTMSLIFIAAVCALHIMGKFIG